MEGVPSPFADARLYDAQYDTLTKDVRFYQKLAKNSSPPILELGVGTGRIAKGILKEGISFVGLDASPEMLQQAARNLESYKDLCSLSEGDFREFTFDQTFGLIFGAFNSLHYLETKEDLARVLERVHHHLKPDGIFAFDLINPSLDALTHHKAVPFLRERFFDERSEQVCEVWESSEYDPVKQIKVQHWEYRWVDGKKQNSSVRMIIYSPVEVKNMLVENGFKAIRCFGDFDEGSLSAVSPKQIFVCAKS